MLTHSHFWIGVAVGAVGFVVTGIVALWALVAWWDTHAPDSRDEDAE